MDMRAEDIPMAGAEGSMSELLIRIRCFPL